MSRHRDSCPFREIVRAKPIHSSRTTRADRFAQNGVTVLPPRRNDASALTSASSEWSIQRRTILHLKMWAMQTLQLIACCGRVQPFSMPYYSVDPTAAAGALWSATVPRAQSHGLTLVPTTQLNNPLLQSVPFCQRECPLRCHWTQSAEHCRTHSVSLVRTVLNLLLPLYYILLSC